jgi:hypothetical protein
MEQSCQRCGSQIESLTPFCPNCAAPQIHFHGRQPSSNPVVVSGMQLPVVVADQPGAPLPPTSYNQNAALRSALHAGVVAAILSLIPLRSAFLFALPIAGFLCVLLYRRRVSGEELSVGSGFKLGSLAGLFALAFFVVLTATATLVSHAENELREAMLQAIRQAQARSPDAQARQMLDYFTTPHGLMVMMILGFAFTGVMFVLLSGLGGSISAKLLHRKRPPA